MAKKDKKGKDKEQSSDLVIAEPAAPFETNADDTDANLTGDGIIVPPPTPSSQYELELNFEPIPPKLSTVEDLQIPLVRKNGIKLCIDVLAEYFQCEDYKFNLFQFWFLDVVTDCLWKVQDEFRFPDKFQKTVLEWILFIFDKMRDPQEDITRKKLFTIFKESILLCADYVDEGGTELPSPQKLLELNSQEPSRSSGTVTSSVSLHSSDEDVESIVLFNDEKKATTYSIKREICQCNQFDVESVESVTESQVTPSESGSWEDEVGEETSSEEENSAEDIWESQGDCLVEELKAKFEIVSAPGSLTPSIATPCPSNIFATSPEPEPSKAEVEESKVLIVDANKNIDCTPSMTEVERADMEFEKSSYNRKMKILTKYLTDINIQAQRTAAMDDPDKGWMYPQEETLGESYEGEEEVDAASESEWTDIVAEHEADAADVEDSVFVNFGVLWAIIDFVFNYFYESFQFTLIKLAFREYPSIICQRVNQDWKEPKVPKGEFIPPPQKKEKKEKKQKKPKEKKGKKGKEKKDKKGKKDKGSKKDKKGKDKKDKKGKKDKGKKSDKKDKKGKKAKPEKLTKEQKEELERIRLEQERIEEERRKEEENRRLMFPLNDVATDDLFNQLFEGWVKVDLSPKGKKDKKNKGKKDKKGKKGKK